MKSKLRRMAIWMIAIMMFVSACGFGTEDLENQEGASTVHAGSYRDGLLLEPMTSGTGGIALDSNFRLTFQDQEYMDKENLRKQLSVSPDLTMDIIEISDGYIIKPTEMMVKGEVYRFTIGKVSWIFQTISDFEVLGTLPADQSNSVPVNTGIEFYFSQPDVPIEEWFHIEPSATGSFERYGSAMVFVPDTLEAETMYTVSLSSKGSSDDLLSEDVIFQFETAAIEVAYETPEGYFNYERILNDRSTDDALYLPIRYNVRDDVKDVPSITTEVYMYDDAVAMSEALKGYMAAPNWRYYGDDYLIDVDGLTKVISFEQRIEEVNGYEMTVDIPVDLPQGHYLIRSSWKEVAFQTFLQVTDLSAYHFEDEIYDYYWVNRLDTSLSAEGAYLVGDIKVGADEAGFMKVKKELVEEAEDVTDMTVHVLSDGEYSLVMYSGQGYGNYDERQDYWRYLQTDRLLYKPEDDVSYFGYIQNRDDGSYPERVTVRLIKQQWLYYDFMPGFEEAVPLVEETMDVDNGFFEGYLTLPNVAVGSYQVQVLSDELVLSTTYIEVDKFVKPDYKMTVLADKTAVFAGETVNYTISSVFYEGTPLGGLDVNYEAYGMDHVSGALTTDNKGNAYASVSMDYNEAYQEEIVGYLYARAVLPEDGELYGSSSVRVFVNDIYIEAKAEVEDNHGILTVDAHEITLERLNDGSAKDQMDYLDDAVSNHQVDVVIYRNEWVKVPAGTYYDFINKVNVQRYSYELEQEVIQTQQLRTNSDGSGAMQVNLPEEKGVYYTATIDTEDMKGRKMTFSRYFGQQYERFYPEDESLTMSLNEDSYAINDPVEILIERGGDPADGEKFMYLFGNRGLVDVYWSETSELQLPFIADYLPNTQVTGVVFDGDGYETVYSNGMSIDTGDYEMSVSVTSDQSSYRPGQEAVFDIVVTDHFGEEVDGAVVNVALVDEALLSLREMTVDPLGQLYGYVSGGLSGFSSSHTKVGNGYIGGDFGIMTFDGSMNTSMEASKSVERSADPSTVIRDDFKDTAVFRSLKVDSKGHGTLVVELPDNVTSWRLMAAVIKDDLTAGSATSQVNVSLPFFLSTTIANEFLTGDQPSMSVTAYGSGILEDTSIFYTVTCEENDFVASATGISGERIYLPLFEMVEGEYHLVVTAKTDNGFSDGYREVITVQDTYQEKMTVDVHEVVENMTLSASDRGMVTVTFADKSRAKFQDDLYRLSGANGKRVDQMYVAKVASDYLGEYFDVTLPSDEVTISDYITYEGALGILPYSDSDIRVTAKMAKYITGATERLALTNYLYTMYYKGDMTTRMMSLYGLATLGEKVLLEANSWMNVANMNDEDWLWLARTYTAMGDDFMAKALYDEHLSDKVVLYDAKARYEGVEDEEVRYRITAELLPLLAAVEPEQAEMMTQYIYGRYSELYLPSADLLNYVDVMLSTTDEASSTLQYSYGSYIEDVDFGVARSSTIEIPSTMIGQLNVTKVSGDVVAVVRYNDFGKINESVDDSLFVSRKYLDFKKNEEKGNFSVGDIVKVSIDWQIDDAAIDHGYVITDYAPAGLVPINNTWQLGIVDDRAWYRDIEGQRVSFGVYKGTRTDETLMYYARVVSPGTYTAEPLMIQGMHENASVNLTETDRIQIEP